jgi:hypothetical protein
MERDGRNPRQRRYRIETVRGEPFVIGGRTLTPEARIISLGRARATIGTKHLSGWGGAFVQVVPRAIVEETPEGERRIAITDATSSALRGLLGVAIVTTLLLTAIRWCALRSKSAKTRR